MIIARVFVGIIILGPLIQSTVADEYSAIRVGAYSIAKYGLLRCATERLLPPPSFIVSFGTQQFLDRTLTGAKVAVSATLIQYQGDFLVVAGVVCAVTLSNPMAVGKGRRIVLATIPISQSSQTILAL